MLRVVWQEQFLTLLSALGLVFLILFGVFSPWFWEISFLCSDQWVLCWRLWGTVCVSLPSRVLCPVAVLASLGSSSHLLSLGWLRLVMFSLRRLGHLGAVSGGELWPCLGFVSSSSGITALLFIQCLILFIKKEWEVKLSWICKVENHHKP